MECLFPTVGVLPPTFEYVMVSPDLDVKDLSFVEQWDNIAELYLYFLVRHISFDKLLRDLLSSDIRVSLVFRNLKRRLMDALLHISMLQSLLIDKQMGLEDAIVSYRFAGFLYLCPVFIELVTRCSASSLN